MKKYLYAISLIFILLTAACSHDLLLPSEAEHKPLPENKDHVTADIPNSGLPYITYTENYETAQGSNVIMIIFSQPMAPATINQANITLRDISTPGMSNITFTAALGDEQRVLTLQTEHPYINRGNIERILSTNITDIYGRPLAGLGHGTTATGNWRRLIPWEYRAIAANDTHPGTATLIEPATVSTSLTPINQSNLTVDFTINTPDLSLAAPASNISNAFTYSGAGAELTCGDVTLPGLTVELTNMTNGIHTVTIDPACLTNTATYSGGGLIQLPAYVINTWTDGSDFSITYNNDMQSILNPDIWHVDLSLFISISNSGAAVWAEDSAQFSDGSMSLKSGNITHDELSSVTLVINGPANISFDWMVSSESSFDFLRFHIDGIQQNAIDGITGWSTVNDAVGAGVHTLTWTYDKDGSVSQGQDCGWIDNVNITP